MTLTTLRRSPDAGSERRRIGDKAHTRICKLQSMPRLAPAAALIALAFTGCLSAFNSSSSHLFVNGVEFQPARTLLLSAPSGALVYQVNAPHNASVAYSYTVDHSSQVVQPVLLALVSDSVALHAPENRSLASPLISDTYVGAGSDQQLTEAETTLASTGTFDFFYTNATEATFVVIWAGLEEDADLMLYWRPETTVAPIATGAASAWRFVDFDGDVRAGSNVARAEPRSELIVGESDTKGILFMRVGRGVATSGRLTVMDDSESRSVSMGQETEWTASEHAMTTSGEVELQLELVSAGGDEIYGIYAEFPPTLRIPAFTIERPAMR